MRASAKYLVKQLSMGLIVLAGVSGIAGCGSNYSSGGGNSGPSTKPVTATGSVNIYPQTVSVPLGGTASFLANLPSQPGATFTWSMSSGSGLGSINSTTGIYTAPTGAVPSPATVTITATSTGSGLSAGSATVTIVAAQPVTMTPSAVVVKAGAQTAIVATVGGNPATVTEWDVNGIAGGNAQFGTITGAGVYTAPLAPPPGGATTITAKTASASGATNVAVVYSNSSFNGPYAFSYIGDDGTGLLQVVGSFTANGAAGTITAGMEDISSGKSGVKTATTFSGGTFTVGPDGTATATPNDGSTWQFLLTGNTGTAASLGRPAQHALLVRFDSSGTGSGTIDQQTATALNTPFSPVGNYVFTLSGTAVETNNRLALLETAGVFHSNAVSAGTNAEWDVNVGGTVVNDTSLTATFSTDSANPGTGRGTLTLNTTAAALQTAPISITQMKFAIYVIDATHVKAVEIDGSEFAAGDIFNSPNTNGSFALNSLKAGNYAFTTAGGSSNGAYVQGGVFTSNGAGAITGGILDTNGGVGAIALGYPVTQTAYTVDANLGRIALPLTATLGGTTLNFQFAGYLTASGNVLMIETDTGANVKTVVSGIAFPQSSKAALVGGYALNFSSIANVANTNGLEEDDAGQFIANADGTIRGGSVSTNLFGSTSQGRPITAAIINAPDANGRGVATITTSGASYPLAYYVVDANTALVTETDAVRVLVGTFAKQF